MRMGIRKEHGIILYMKNKCSSKTKCLNLRSFVVFFSSFLYILYTSLLRAYNHLMRVVEEEELGVDKYQAYVSIYVHTNLSNWSAHFILLYLCIDCLRVCALPSEANDIFICEMSLILNRVKWTAEFGSSHLFDIIAWRSAISRHRVYFFFFFFCPGCGSLCTHTWYGVFCSSLNYNFWTVFNY